MTPSFVRSLLAALDLVLRTLSAFEALGTVHTTFRNEHQSRQVEAWRLYSKTWEALFESAQDAMLLVSRMLVDLEQNIDVFSLSDRKLAETLGRVFGARYSFDRAVKNYRAALSDFERVRATFEADRTHENYQLKERADDRRGTWYRELHARFTEYERALNQLDATRGELIAMSEKEA